MKRNQYKLSDLNQERLAYIKTIGEFLAVNNWNHEPLDLVIVLGSASIEHLEEVADIYHQGLTKKIMLVGGIGHSTQYLFDNLKKHSIFAKNHQLQGSEAEIYNRILSEYYNIPKDVIFIEKLSTNCGNNASYAYQLMIKEKLVCSKALLIQDPTMQRRSLASFEKEWEDVDVVWYCKPAFIPTLSIDMEGNVYFEGEVKAPWTVERYISLVLGEIPRLRDDESGYGPRGQGFIGHVDIPKHVIKAYVKATEGCITEFVVDKCTLVKRI